MLHPHIELRKGVVRTFRWMPVTVLRRHERTRPDAIARLVACLRRDMRDPHATPPTIPAVLVCYRSLAIIDGHHRYEALKTLGCTTVPAMLLDYQHPDIVLRSQSDQPITKADVIETAAGEGFMAPKQTAHLVRERGSDTLWPLPVLSPTCPVVVPRQDRSHAVDEL